MPAYAARRHVTRLAGNQRDWNLGSLVQITHLTHVIINTIKMVLIQDATVIGCFMTLP